MKRWCWICRWVHFTEPVLLKICTSCKRDPIAGFRMRRKIGDDVTLDVQDSMKVGMRVRLRRDVRRDEGFSDPFLVPAGSAGVVVYVAPLELAVRFDNPIRGRKMYGNVVYWEEDDLEEIDSDISASTAPQLEIVR